MSRKTLRRQRPTLNLLPLGALAAGFGLASAAMAQTAPAPKPAAAEEAALPTVRVKASAEKQGKDDYQATETRIGKGKQDIRDIPQSITVITEKVMDDRGLTNVKEVLKNTAGITFQAAEGGEEDIKIHGISLQSTGDVFIDGMRDPAFYDRDTFFMDKVELLRGSASLLFGRGSTGGAVNQVNKQARLSDENEVSASFGSHNAIRVVGDFNLRTGENAAVRIGTMVNEADSNGSGSKISKAGLAGTVRWGIDEQDEFSLTGFALQNDNGMNYGVRWIRPTPTSRADTSTLVPIDPDAYYGLSSDYNKGTARYVTLTHTHRFSKDVELLTKVRSADYTRDQRATLWNFGGAAVQPDRQAVSLATLNDKTVITRGLQIKKQDMQTLTAQSDLNAKFTGFGFEHLLQTGVDFANEKKQVFASNGANGVVPAKPSTTLGTPFDGASINEDVRTFRTNNDYTSKAYGFYLQDLVQIAPAWKVLAGLRYDNLDGKYNQYSAAVPPVVTSYQMKISEVSKRAAVLFQPDGQWSFHLMGATSFNSSGDTYSLSAANVDIPPEQSVNVELGAKYDTADGKLSTRVGVFRNTKLHERNTDPLVNLVTLSGKRHAAGVDVDVIGRITAEWEVFANFTWMPVSKIDIAAPGAEGQGARPSLTPQYSGTLWTTYQASPKLRVGGGLNARSGQQPNRNPGFFAPKFVTADLMAEYAVQEPLLFKVMVSNVANKRYADALYTAFYVPGTGRVVTVTGTYKF